MPVATFTKTGTKATTAAKLDKKVFGVEVPNHELLKQAYVSYLANGRENLAKTKKRGQISGGGRKPHPQKGTGRARSGSIRNPLWRGGGTIFGPQGIENYTKTINLKAKRLAIRQALSMKAADNKIIVIESFDGKSAKTADSVKLLGKIGAERSVLLVVDQKTDELVRATRNIKTVKVVQANYVNVYNVMNADTVVITAEALKAIHEWLGTSTSSASLRGDK